MNGPFRSTKDQKPLLAFPYGFMRTSIIFPGSRSLPLGYMFTLRSKSESRTQAFKPLPGHSSTLLSQTVQHSISMPLYIDHITVTRLVSNVTIKLSNG